jgi:hypothetical protein
MVCSCRPIIGAQSTSSDSHNFAQATTHSFSLSLSVEHCGASMPGERGRGSPCNGGIKMDGLAEFGIRTDFGFYFRILGIG